MFPPSRIMSTIILCGRVSHNVSMYNFAFAAETIFIRRISQMDEQTRKLLEECSSGCRMATDSFGQVREYVRDTNLLRLIDDYTEKHRQLEEEAASLLKETGMKKRNPGSWLPRSPGSQQGSS